MTTNNDERKKALGAAIAQIEKKHGPGSIMKLGENPVKDIEVIPTGALSLDLALGVGGIPRGRIIEIYGPESSGKTTVALHIIAEAQKIEGVAAFVDAEHALDLTYAKRLGVDIDNLIISQPDSGEQGLDIAESLVRSNAVDIIVIDSVAALVPKAEIDGEMGSAQIGGQARLMSQAMRRLTGAISKTNTVVIFINQLRDKVGVMYGSPETTSGGRALKFYTTIRIDIRKAENIKQGENIIGSKTRVRIVKNKVAPPFKQAEFDIMYGTGISKEGCIIDVAADLDVVKKAGAWYSYGEHKLGQGKEKAKEYLLENPELLEEIEVRVKDFLASKNKVVKDKTEDKVEEQE